MSLELVYKGSVKDVYKKDKDLLFCFSDRYSLFDWGEMPDLIPNKGLSLSLMTYSIYQELKDQGISHHIKQIWDLDLNIPIHNKDVGEVSWSSHSDICVTGVFNPNFLLNGKNFQGFNSSQLKMALCVEPYEKYNVELKDEKFRYTKPDLETFALPLEVVFRFSAVRGSSFFDRIQSADYLKNLGYSESEIKETQRRRENFILSQSLKDQSNKRISGFDLPRPVVEFFTKLEPRDRLLSWSECLNLTSLSPSELRGLVEINLKTALILQNLFKKINFKLWDGKLEWAYDSKNQSPYVLIDSIGPDELRLSYRDFHFSKEYLREIYRPTKWYQQIEEAKKIADQKHIPNWKSLLSPDVKPEPLDPSRIDKVALMYQVLTNEIQRALEKGPIFKVNLEDYLAQEGVE